MPASDTHTDDAPAPRRRRFRVHGTRARRAILLGPAFVAAVAYVDPGNVAANITAGARHGFLLVWVLVVANVIAMVIQYQSAKLGIVTGKSLPTLLGDRLRRPARLGYWAQAEIVAAATDLAEVVGGAIALRLLFDIPLVLGGVIVGVVSIGMLAFQGRRRQRIFESIIVALLVIVVIGFLAGLVVNPPSARDVLGGLVPRLEGSDTVLLAAGMLGATVMPHVIYLHSTLVIDRHGTNTDLPRKRRLLRATRWDVCVALAIAGVVNISLLLLAAQNLRGQSGTDTIDGAYHAVAAAMGNGIAIVFAIGLLASGLASTSVGSYAGAAIMQGLLRVKIPIIIRRVVVLIPALVVLSLDVDPTWALVISQVILSFGIPFAIIPLGRFTGRREVMGQFTDSSALRIAATAGAVVIVVLNISLIVLTVLDL